MRVFSGPHLGEEANTREGGRELFADSLLGTRKRFTLTLLVKPEDGEDPCDLTEEDALAATGVPVLRALENNAYHIGKFAREIDSVNGVWRVFCYFDSSVPGANVDLEWQWSGETIEKVLHRDPVTGLPIVNAVGERLLLTAPVAIPVLTVEKIKPTFDPDEYLLYQNRCNLIPFVGAPAPCALLHTIEETPIYQGGIRMSKVQYVIKFDLSFDFDTGLFLGWAVQLLNHGTKYRVPTLLTTPDGRTILATSGEPVYEAFLDLYKNPTTGNLNLDGTWRNPSLPPTWIIYNRFPRADFTPLDIDPYAP